VSVRPWHKRYHSDALTGFRPLSLEERGAYQTLLDMIYDTGGSIADNERYLAGAMNCTMGKWRKLRQALIDQDKIAIDEDGRIANFRAIEELKKAEKHSETCKESGQKGGKNKSKLPEKDNKNRQGDENSLEGNASHLRDQNLDKDKLEIYPQGQGSPDGGQSRGDPNPSKYEFEGAIIRLIPRDFHVWRERYHAIPDIKAELGTLDDWLQGKPDKQKGWFQLVSGALGRKHGTLMAEREAAANAPAYVAKREISDEEREAIRQRLIASGEIDG
jgi:uncharacterized protein YdaU (DUF1376 family)